MWRMETLRHGLLSPWFFEKPSYSLPPEPKAPTADETRAQAEAAAQLEKENLKKKRRPTLLTGYGGVDSTTNLMSSTLAGKAKLGQ